MTSGQLRISGVIKGRRSDIPVTWNLATDIKSKRVPKASPDREESVVFNTVYWFLGALIQCKIWAATFSGTWWCNQ